VNTTINAFNGGVTSAKGFKASGIHCGLRKNKGKYDLACIFASHRCPTAAVYTTNRVFSSPITVTRENLADGMAQAVICNSGNANTCNGDGYETASQMGELLAEGLGIDKKDIVVASTGVIGVPLPIEPIKNGIPALVAALGDDEKAETDAATAILTTDIKMKKTAVSFELDGKTVTIGGMCKGSGMIHPNMATMLGFVTTDAAITSAMLQKALREAVADSFNMVSVDGDTSTNDMVCVMASGEAGNNEIAYENEAYTLFVEGLKKVCTYLAMAIAADGEGATKLLQCNVINFSDKTGARLLAKSVIRSSLVKAAMFGSDANWGRVLCALGYAGVDFDPQKVDLYFRSKEGAIAVCRDGKGLPFDEDEAKKILLAKHVFIDCDMKDGDQRATAYGCDLSYEYVRINGDYRS